MLSCWMEVGERNGGRYGLLQCRREVSDLCKLLLSFAFQIYALGFMCALGDYLEMASMGLLDAAMYQPPS